jgi:hypothetical protein
MTLEELIQAEGCSECDCGKMVYPLETVDGYEFPIRAIKMILYEEYTRSVNQFNVLCSKGDRFISNYFHDDVHQVFDQIKAIQTYEDADTFISNRYSMGLQDWIKSLNAYELEH